MAEAQTPVPDPVPKHASFATQEEPGKTGPRSRKALGFWLVFLGLCFAGFVSATIIFTALPTISNDLGGDVDYTYIWLANAIRLRIHCDTAPLCGVAGGANTPGMFIAGRLVQGLGAGGMVMLIDYLGNTIFVRSITSILISPILGGIVHPWSSRQTVLPLVIGFVGWAVFFDQQGYCKEPTMLLRLFAHRTYLFIRSLGFVWGTNIPSIVFNSRIEAGLGSVDNPKVRVALSDGGAYSYALDVRELTGQTLRQTLRVHEEALRIVWFVGLAFALVGLLLVFIEKHVDMRVTLDTEFGFEEAPRSRPVGADIPQNEA